MTLNLNQYLLDIEKITIENILKAYNGNITKTANWLELNRTTLVMKIERLKIDIEVCCGYDEPKECTRQIHKISGLNTMKRNAIMDALQKCNFNRHQAADMVGMSYRTVCTFVRECKDQGILMPNKTKKMDE